MPSKPSIERSIDLDDPKVSSTGGSTGGSKGASTSKSTQDIILASSNVAPLAPDTGSKSAGNSGGKTDTKTTGGSSGTTTTKSTQDSILETTEIQPVSSGTTYRTTTTSSSSHGPRTTTTTSTRKSTDADDTDKPAKDDPIWQKLALVGAIAAAGVAIVAGARRLQKEDVPTRQDKNNFDKLKRKTADSAHDAKHSASHAAGNIGDSVSGFGEKLSHAAGDIKDQVTGHGHGHSHGHHGHHHGDSFGQKIENKAEQAKDLAKEKAEQAKQEAKHRMDAENTRNAEKARLDAIAEQKRMALGQDSKGVPKQALKDTGDGFLNYKAWWPWAKRDL